MNSSNSLIASAAAAAATTKTKKADKKDKGYEVSRRMEGGIVVSRIDGKKVE